MPVESAKYVNQLKPQQPAGGESISEGDDHLRTIKYTLTESFPNISSAVTSTPAQLNKVGQIDTDLEALKSTVGDLDSGAHGNVASCYWNPQYNPKLVYGHNVREVIKDPNFPDQTKINFITPLEALPGGGNVAGHYGFSVTPVSGTGNPTLLTVVAQTATHINFLAWHLIGETWTIIPGTELAFSFTCVDMESLQ
jgi:hypothetical protein